MNIDNKVIILRLIAIAFEQVKIKSEIFRIKKMKLEQLHQRLTELERLKIQKVYKLIEISYIKLTNRASLAITWKHRELRTILGE